MTAAQAADIRLEIEAPEAGVLHAELHAAEAGDWSAPLQRISGDTEALAFRDVPAGRYAVQLFVDLDGDGLLALSPRGIPREPVGFSGNPRLQRSKPMPEDCAFEHGVGDSPLFIELQRAGARGDKSTD